MNISKINTYHLPSQEDHHFPSMSLLPSRTQRRPQPMISATVDLSLRLSSVSICASREAET